MNSQSGLPASWVSVIRARRAKEGGSRSRPQVLGILVLVVVLGACIGILRHGFLTRENFSVLTYEVSTTSMIALGQMVVLGSGAMDLSVGGIGGLVGVIAGWALVVAGFPIPAAVALAVAVGAACGFINGWLIGRLEFSGATAFLVTLASGTFYAGVTLGLTGAIPYYNLPNRFDALSDNAIGGVPWMFFVMLVIAAGLWFVYNMTSIGTKSLALGGDARAARLCGVRVRRVLLVTFIVSGCLAGSGSVLHRPVWYRRADVGHRLATTVLRGTDHRWHGIVRRARVSCRNRSGSRVSG